VFDSDVSFILNSCKEIWGMQRVAHLWWSPDST